jgi:hypothetical protein
MSSYIQPVLDEGSGESTTITIERFVRDAAQGRIDAVKKIMKDRLMKDRVSQLFIYFDYRLI